MNVRRLIAPGLVIIALVVVSLWLGRGFFQRNHITYLLNQGEYDQALVELGQLKSRSDERPKTRFLETKALVLTGDYGRALEVSASESLWKQEPRTLYLRALAQYHLGMDEEAQESAQQFLQTDTKLPYGGLNIVRVLAGEPVVLEPQDRNAFPFRMLFQPERAAYVAIVADQQLDIGRLDLAARQFKEAFLLGNRNSTMAVEAAKVCALLGDAHAARMFYDHAKIPGIEPVFEALWQRHQSGSEVALSLQSEVHDIGSRRIDVARAVAWAANIMLQENASRQAHVEEVMAMLLEEYPYDPVLIAHEAEMYVALGNADEARSRYEALQERTPSYETLLRLFALENLSEDEITSRGAAFLRELKPEGILDAAELDVVEGSKHLHFIRLDGGGVVSGELDIADRGTYNVSVIARPGDDHQPRLLGVSVNGEVYGLIYAWREDWDCYTLPVALETGEHLLELQYGDEASTDTDALFIRSVYVTGAGTR